MDVKFWGRKKKDNSITQGIAREIVEHEDNDNAISKSAETVSSEVSAEKMVPVMEKINTEATNQDIVKSTLEIPVTSDEKEQKGNESETASIGDIIKTFAWDEEKQKSLLGLITEIWRFKQFYDPFYTQVTTNNEKLNKKIRNHSERLDKYVKKYIDALQLEIVDFTNQEYQAELPIEPMNLDQFKGDKALVVEGMVEPTIKVKNSTEILQKGKVYLMEVE